MTVTPPVVDRGTWQEQVDALLVREKAHTREDDAIAAAARQLPMVEVAAATPVVGAAGDIPLIETFEGRLQLFASYHMWHIGLPAAGPVQGLQLQHRLPAQAVIPAPAQRHLRGVSARARTTSPRVTATAWVGDAVALRARGIVGPDACRAPLRDEVLLPASRRPRVRDVLDHRARMRGDGNSYGMLDMIVYGRQEPWEDSPKGWPPPFGSGRPMSQ